MTVLSLFKDIVDQTRKPRSPVDVFDEVLREREKRYGQLRETALRVLYTKNKLEADLVERRAEIARIFHAARKAARRGDDARCLRLLTEKRALERRLERAEAGVADARLNADTARRALDDFSAEMRELERERAERSSALDTATLQKQLDEIRNEPRRRKEDAKLDLARKHIDDVATEASLERCLTNGDAFVDDELEDDTDLKIELARLKHASRPYTRAV